jgi:hypothetical protein
MQSRCRKFCSEESGEEESLLPEGGSLQPLRDASAVLRLGAQGQSHRGQEGHQPGGVYFQLSCGPHRLIDLIRGSDNYLSASRAEVTSVSQAVEIVQDLCEILLLSI